MLGRYQGVGNGIGRARPPLDVSAAIAALGAQGSHLRSAVIEIERPVDMDPDQPISVGPPQRVAATGTALARSRPFSWDVNGWYRDLGIPWPYVDATRGDIRAAGAHAERDVSLAYGLRVLLGKVSALTRAEYDAMELGDWHVDPYEQRRRRTLLKAKAERGSAELAHEGIRKSAQEVLADMGYSEVEQEEYDQIERDSRTTMSAVSGTPFSWGFWLQGDRGIDYEHLRTWQGYLVTAINTLAPKLGRGLEGFAVGLTTTVSRWYVDEIEHEIVFMLGDDRPTEHAAYQAALFALENYGSSTTPTRSTT